MRKGRSGSGQRKAGASGVRTRWLTQFGGCMPRFRAIYRDHVSDRNPVREEVILSAEDVHAALVAARKRTTRSIQLIAVIQLEDEPQSGTANRSDAAD